MTTLLVANRGEIALRIFRTAKALGLRTVAIHTDLDANAPHARAADVAVRVGSYLDIDAIVAAARETGAALIHPGYGFLSERAAFARAVEEAGLRLVGPSAAVMDLMGRKDAAREVAVKAGVPVVPSYEIDATDMAFPVLVKAAAGGGGKGMRIVRSAGEYEQAVEAARREAASAFGDDTLLVEKYVASGRHVEVQVLADSHGTVVHLFERDCSTQRRHQKVLEEAPAPTITEETREAITSAAVALAREVGYVNAGTVEFLLDNDSGAAYFLEMNTRLQVEHPVTELAVAVNGEHPDLVAMQLKVAAGEELGFRQHDVTLSGHAIEARVYAEDPYAGFLPQAGVATEVRWSSAARNDHALESGQEVSTAYDPMLGKVIAAGPDRETARLALVQALDDTAILGLTTNVGFLRALAASEEFRDAVVDTSWLDRHEPERPDPAAARTLAAWAWYRSRRRHDGPFRSDGFRLGATPAPVVVTLDEPVTLTPPEPTGTAVVHGQHIEVVHQGQRFTFDRPDASADHGAEIGDGTLLAPMPGTLLAVDVEVGDRVEEGQRLGVLEAMKMEVALKAPFAGTVASVGGDAGDLVQLKQLLFEVSSDD
ncbi:MAG: ATP-grasp domain-containing protein [Nocardioidaceae bacterium]|nr:ATP-grasp domain-containing protein [Nocardioidaceae bacterium]